MVGCGSSEVGRVGCDFVSGSTDVQSHTAESMVGSRWKVQVQGFDVHFRLHIRFIGKVL